MGQAPHQIDPVEAQRAAAVEKIERELVERFGLLLTIEHLAELFHRSAGGLRWTLNQQGEFADTVNLARVKIGRRTYYRAAGLAEIIA